MSFVMATQVEPAQLQMPGAKSRSPSSTGVCAPDGFLAAGVAAGIKKSGAEDLALIVSETPCVAAGVFTINTAKAAPVVFDIERLQGAPVRGIVVNSGNANACTGAEGLRNARRMSETASEICSQSDKTITAASADGRGNTASGRRAVRADFLVCSTGRIGVQLPMPKIIRGIREAARQLSADGLSTARAIMTTDTYPKQMVIEIRVGGRKVRLGGITKGAGMIEPVMSPSGKRPGQQGRHATMLAFLTTDLLINRRLLQECLNRAVARSFNRISVDGDMSTNDTVLLLANGHARNPPLRRNSTDLRRFQSALDHMTLGLAQMIVRDGEGISRVVTVEITGAASPADAESAVRAIGNSTLVKCSWCGGDPNWGRLCDAVGYSGARFNPARFTITYDGVDLVRNGLPIGRNLPTIRRAVAKPAFHIEFDLKLGSHRAILYTTDLTEKYVELNKGE